MDIAEIRSRLNEKKGPEYWRSLEELADSEAFQQMIRDEFPSQASVLDQSVDRRDFLKFMAASLAMMGLTACGRSPLEKIIPYSKMPEEVIPGKPLYYATAALLDGYAEGVLVETHTARPTKVEGNPRHPESGGHTSIFGQSQILTLYDPDRSQTLVREGQINTWGAFLGELRSKLERQEVMGGRTLRILTQTITSPTMIAQMGKILQRFPKAKWHSYDAANRDSSRAGTQIVLGQMLDTQYRFQKADVILSLDSDFLSPGPGHLQYIREFTDRRRVRDGSKNEMNRLYAVESTPGLVGSFADHRLRLKAGKIREVAEAIAQGLGIQTGSVSSRVDAHEAQWIRALVKDLKNKRSRSLVVAGENQPAEVHALAILMNQVLSNIGETVVYTKPIDGQTALQSASLKDLVKGIEADEVELLVVIGGNPVYDAPANLNFSKNYQKIPFRIHMGLYADETGRLSHWQIPETHPFEAWSDARSFDGTATLIQPLIQPLYNGRSPHEMLAVIAGEPVRPAHDIVKEYWKGARPSLDFEKFWERSLHDGLIQGTASPVVSPAVTSGLRLSGRPASDGIELQFQPDPTVRDGSFANNGWLQELPKPLSKLVWDNAAYIGPRMAQEFDLKAGDVVTLTYRGRELDVPVWIEPGQPDQAIALHLGYGREAAGHVGNSLGVSAYRLRTFEEPWFGSGVQVRKTSKHASLVSTQDHSSMEGRNLVRSTSLEDHKKHPHAVHEGSHDPSPQTTLYGTDHPYESYAWGMSVDLSTCIGCNACVIACQSENNIPVVGKDQVANGREMHWIRLDRYYQGDPDEPNVYYQPVMCQHCEDAPCEPVCPVGATMHSKEGLNEMVYNRCVGTRYCANNCPYKVRRFNFFQYADKKSQSGKLMQNPDVTVRSRGVMEKCTYCVQRINTARITAKKEDRSIKDGEVVSACQSACPAGAIVFGDINDPNSKVSKEKSDPLTYGLLTELGTRPRTSYMARLKNPNPELEEFKLQHGV